MMMFVNRYTWLSLLQSALLIQAASVSTDVPINRTSYVCPYRCLSGECISLERLCDGTVDCRDKSDETAATCDKLVCPGYTFRCDYGACVAGTDVCNGESDCADGSDEQKWLCVAQMMQENCNHWEIRCSSGQCVPYSRLCDGHADCDDGDDEAGKLCAGVNNTLDTSNKPSLPILLDLREAPEILLQDIFTTRAKGCIVPHLQNIIMKNKFNELLPAGTSVENGTKLYLSCQTNHKLLGEERNYCAAGHWHEPFAYCRSPIELSFILVTAFIGTLCVVLLYMIYKLQRDWLQPKDKVWFVESSDLHVSGNALAAAATVSR